MQQHEIFQIHKPERLIYYIDDLVYAVDVWQMNESFNYEWHATAVGLNLLPSFASLSLSGKTKEEAIEKAIKYVHEEFERQQRGY
ncbi:hypothetical protein BEH_11670 [Priestia filamentosa]|uniref:Uncharacterized protein n=1 Tax=Priestia filamentosa TaxID=1402861 RepID=A0A0H4KK83_9BACI|nr:hypothetical protein [Priestia filamentosa]AKO92694.1 hypothetical protein BEH_11670 [Priestia filamentosa]